MAKKNKIPKEWRERCPLLSEQSYLTWKAIQEDVNAPRWNHQIGDRIQSEDLESARRFYDGMKTVPSNEGQPSASILTWVLSHRETTWTFEKRLFRCRSVEDLSSQWPRIETCDREDLVTNMAQFVPHEMHFDRALVYDTSGTTGHPLELFHHPRALAKNHKFADAVFDNLGIDPEWSPDKMGVLNICAQRHTFVFCTSFSIWNGSGFAKINLHESDWVKGKSSARNFCQRWNPSLITSDPISLTTAMQWNLPLQPKLVFSTAVGLTPELQSQLEKYFGCPVINWYAATEIGPIACSQPGKEGLMVVAPDLFVEIVDEFGVPVPFGQPGEICVTGGRNPYLPLLRYRTGDFARMEKRNDDFGNERNVLHDLQGREWVTFFDENNQNVNSVDIDRVIRSNGVFVQHQVHQPSLKRLIVRIRPVENLPPNETGMLRQLQALFGVGVSITIEQVSTLGDSEKIRPYICDVSSRTGQ